MEKKNIEERAQKVLDAYQYNYKEDTYVDSVCLARFFGFDVQELSSLPASEDGSVTVSINSEDNSTEKCIVVNDFRSFEYKRFIIAHELAHYLLHYTGNNKFFMHRENVKGKNLEENDADFLAVCLLMPKQSFKNQYELLKHGRSSQEVLRELQQKFRTPEESIKRRIEEVCNGC